VYLSADPGRQQPVVLREPDDFASFMVVAAARSWAELGRMLGDACRVDPPNVWVDPAEVRALGKASDPDWVAGLDAMLEYASRRGWTDGSGAVRAHCEWPLGEPGSP
jgi:hypothetical protein